MTVSRPLSSLITWPQVFALAGLQGAISLSWVAYRAYLPKLFEQIGLTIAFASSILVFEALIGLLLEPVMGFTSDRLRQWMGTRFPLIALGVILAAILFVTIPIVVRGGESGQLVLPILVIGWAIAMTMFRSPMLVLLGTCATPKSLPRAASVVMLVSMTISAFAAITSQALLRLGAGVTFAVGSLVLMLAVGVLWFVLPRSETSTPEAIYSGQTTGIVISESPWLMLQGLRVILAAIAVAWSTRWLLGVVGSLPKTFSQLSTPSLMVGFNVIAAFGCLGMGWLATRYGNVRCVVGTAAIAIPAILILSVTQNGIIAVTCLLPLALLLGSANTGAIPFALSVMPGRLGGLAIGLYFGALGATFGTFDWVFGQLLGDLTQGKRKKKGNKNAKKRKLE